MPNQNSGGEKKLRDQKRAEFDAITERRQKMLKAEQERAKQRAAIQSEELERQKKEYGEQVAAARKDVEGREAWRQGKHQERAEDQVRKRKEQEVKLSQAEAKAKRDEEEAKRTKNMEELHAQSLKKKVEAKIDAAKNEEMKQKRDASHRAEMRIGQADQDAEKKAAHFASEFRRKKTQLMTFAEKRRTSIETEAKLARSDAQNKSREEQARVHGDREKIRNARLEESRALSQIESSRKRELSSVEEKLAADLAMLDAEANGFKQEIRREAELKKQRAATDAARLSHDAQARREGVESWFNRGDDSVIKDPLDLT